jgi:anti-sigma B factor antagonist
MMISPRRLARRLPEQRGGAPRARQTGPAVPATAVHDHGPDTVVAPAGELDIYTIPALRETLLDLIAADRTRIVVDLGAVTFLDSTALGVLVGAYKRLATMGGRLRVVCPAGPLAEVFRVTGLDGVLPLSATIEDALA